MPAIASAPSCLLAALDYLEKGLAPIPLKPYTKVPLFKEWQAQKLTPAQLEARWKACHKANVGVVMGLSGLIGLDIDGAAGENLLIEWAGDNPIPETWAFTTPNGGQRLLYQLPHGTKVNIKSFKAEEKEALRILAGNSQTVMPPSRLENGEYLWCPECSPDHIPLAPCPDWLLAKLTAFQVAPGVTEVSPSLGADQGGESAAAGKPGEYTFPAPTSNEEDHARLLKRARAYLNKCDHAISGQGGHDITYRVACKLVGQFCLSENDALDLLMNDYNPRCEPPWSEQELLHKVQSALTSHKEDGRMAHDPPPVKRLYAKPPSLNGHKKEEAKKPEKTLNVHKMEHIQSEPVPWLWTYWIPLGMLTVLDGDPGLGKSTLLIDLAARLSRGDDMPDGTPGIVGKTLLLSAEDHIKHTVRQRLDAAAADPCFVRFLDSVIVNGHDRGVEIPSDIDVLKQLIIQEEIKLVVIDPLMAYLTGCDAMKDQEVRRALRRLHKLAEETGCAIVLLRHLNKSNGTKAIYRGGGSIGIIGAARSGLIVARDPDNEDRRILAHPKYNLAPPQNSLAFRLEPTPDGQACRVVFEGESKYKADELVAPPGTEEEKEQKEEAKSKLEEAIDWLLEFLAGGKERVKDCINAARAEAIETRTVQRAARKVCDTIREGSIRYWQLNKSPSSPKVGEMASSPQLPEM
jgi:AAA domain/Bifunctional DNA primase/polymerase, N-terminal